MFGYRVSLWRNAWRKNKHIASFVLAMVVTVGVLTAVAAMIAPAPESVPSTVSLPQTEYCYTSEDGDWLICRLEE